MDANFWHQKWNSNEIAFHESEPNPLLIRHLPSLCLATNSRIFLPLCGKTHDIGWLLANGYRVAGAELSKIAIEQLFAELGLEPDIARLDNVDHYRAANIDIFVGDIFALSREMLGHVDAIYDRAALVALPETLRNKYTAHLIDITNKAPQLLICYEYDQRVMDGPPFSISSQQVHEHYANNYDLSLLACTVVPGGLKSKCAATESTWLLKNH